MAGYYKADDVRRAANGRWIDVLGRLGVNTEFLTNRHGPCPGCGGRDRFRYDDKNGEGTFLCSQGGGGNLSGDGIDLLMHVTQKEWKECLRMVGEIVLGDAGLRQGREGSAANAGVVRQAPRAREEWIPEFNLGKLRGMTLAMPAVNEDWFMERSPVDPRKVTPGEFLEHCFRPGERVMVFTEFRGTGDFLWEVGKGGYRLGEKRGVSAVRSNLPVDGGADGVWYLCNPLDGQWYANPRQQGKFSRRSQESVTSWRHLVLECDEEKTFVKRANWLREASRLRELGKVSEIDAGFRKQDPRWAKTIEEAPETWLATAAQYDQWAPEVPGLWMRFLAMAPLAIKAIYSSGGASWHALVEGNWPDKATFDTYLRNSAKRTLPIIGADPGAMTPVRLTRLPGCTRNGREQKLIYLNPNPSAAGVPVRDLVRLRSL